MGKARHEIPFQYHPGLGQRELGYPGFHKGRGYGQRKTLLFR